MKFEIGKQVEAIFVKTIMKTKVSIKYVWEIGEDGMKKVVIREEDNPIIPLEHSKDAP